MEGEKEEEEKQRRAFQLPENIHWVCGNSQLLSTSPGPPLTGRGYLHLGTGSSKELQVP